MIIFGKSIQDGTPTPDSPVEIQSVVKPKLRIVGGTKGALLTEVQYNTLTTTLNSYLNDRKEIYYVPENDQGFDNCVIIVLNSADFKSIYPIGTVSNYTASNWITIIHGIGTLLCSSTVDPKETIGYGIEPQTVSLPYTLNAIPVSSGGNVTIDGQQYIADYVDVERGKLVRIVDSSKLDNTQSIIDKTEWLLAETQEIDLTTEEITAFKALETYYPTTNISVNSKQLDGYIIFNYPISMQNGWNYVKQQIGDAREYIYDMDLQSAEAYVNSEYAVALTELEV